MIYISVFGAGKSSFYLLEYLSGIGKSKGWQLNVYDKSPELVSPFIRALDLHVLPFDLELNKDLDAIILNSDMVISLLPPALHLTVAKACLRQSKNLATASYVSPELKELHAEAKLKGLIFLNELGLDPGIDHLSAMKITDSIKAQGGEIISFESFCGGLIDKSDVLSNPWGYKFSWNPKNVILAGQGGSSVFRKNGELRYIPWHQLYTESQTCYVPDVGTFDAYANRDSLAYASAYGLENVPTFFRATLRRKHFCRAWQVLVSLGFTDATTLLHPSIQSALDLACALTGMPRQGIAFADWLLQNRLIDANLAAHFSFLGLNSEIAFRKQQNTPAEMFQTLLEDKWKLQTADKDEVIMFHHFIYRLNDQIHHLKSVLNLKGEDSFHTAMARTVGLPLALGVELIMGNQITETGVIIPLSPQWYTPILSKLEQLGISFSEENSIQ